jgi:hypothetical protein
MCIIGIWIKNTIDDEENEEQLPRVVYVPPINSPLEKQETISRYTRHYYKVYQRFLKRYKKKWESSSV